MNWKNWNPYTADEEDPYPAARQAEIERIAENLMGDEAWIAGQFEDGRIGKDTLFKAIAEAYKPGKTLVIVGGLLMDELWDLATAQAEETVDGF